MLCNDSTNQDGNEIGDPTETALINLADKWGVHALDARKKYPRGSEIPFDSDRKLMSTLHEMDGKVVMVTKGAVDVICDRVASIQKKGEEAPFTPQDRKELARMNQYFSEDGLRVLAFAYKVLDRPHACESLPPEKLTNIFIFMSFQFLHIHFY